MVRFCVLVTNEQGQAVMWKVFQWTVMPREEEVIDVGGGSYHPVTGVYHDIFNGNMPRVTICPYDFEAEAMRENGGWTRGHP